MNVGDEIRDAVEEAVTRSLAIELETRGLLLAGDRFAAAETQAAADGERLLTSAIHRCYPLSEFDTQVVTLEFDSEVAASRVRSALAFGAATSDLLSSSLENRSAEIALISAIFNLGIGLVDGVCDEDAGTGLGLLQLIEAGNVAEAARQPRPRGWLRVHLPAALESDPSVSFAADIVETFFATLHAAYPGESWLPLRDHVGVELAAALEAERGSIVASSAGVSREQMTRYSYDTSVLPFQIVGTLTLAPDATAAARFVGEAMWRIDDLVDLCDDAHTGAVNAVLLAANGRGRDALQWLVESGHIARTAAEAAEALRRGMELAVSRDDTACRDVFLQFVARYAGIVPRDAS